MRCLRDTDLSEFATAVLPHLEREPVRNNVACTIVNERLGPTAPTRCEPDARWLRVLDGQGALAGVAIHTPPRRLMLTEMSGRALDVLADHLAGLRLPGVSGPRPAAEHFAARWAALTGDAVRESWAIGVFELGTLSPPSGIAGHLREARAADRALLLAWSAAFEAETVPGSAGAVPGAHDADRATELDKKLALGGLIWVWESADEPVCMAWLRPPVAGVVRISAVYTPPDRRGHGFASSCVAAVAQAALDRGAVGCMLNTDLSNPTSNKIYRAVGFRRIREDREWTFMRP